LPCGRIGLSAVMAGASAKQTKQYLECALGRTVLRRELYEAHFPRHSGAAISFSQRIPSQYVARVAFPQASKSEQARVCLSQCRRTQDREASLWPGRNRPRLQMPGHAPPPGDPPFHEMEDREYRRGRTGYRRHVLPSLYGYEVSRCQPRLPPPQDDDPVSSRCKLWCGETR